MKNKDLISDVNYDYDRLVIFLRNAAYDQGIYSAEIARRTGMRQPNVFRFFKSCEGVNYRTFAKIARVLGYKVTLEKIK